jgi:hypothetical protein
MGAGLQRILKLYGKMIVKDEHGKTVVYVYDYANDKAMLQSEMTKEMTTASEKAKYELFRRQMDSAIAEREKNKNLNDPPF